MLALAFTTRSHAAMDLFGDLGDQWAVNGNAASMRLDDGRMIGLWLGDRVVEVSIERADGVVFIKAVPVEYLLSHAPEELAKTAYALVGEVVRAAEAEAAKCSTVATRHGAVAEMLLTRATAATGFPSPMARQLLQRIVRLTKPLTVGRAQPLGADIKRELAALQIKLYDLSAANMSVNASTALGNMIGALLSDDADQQRKALGWT